MSASMRYDSKRKVVKGKGLTRPVALSDLRLGCLVVRAFQGSDERM